jgi:hypothetical protein
MTGFLAGAERRLKRGLKDLSPIFQPAEPLTDRTVGNPVQSLSFFCPSYPADSLFLNSFLASQLASPERPCTVISVRSRHTRRAEEGRTAERLGDHLTRIDLGWDEFIRACERREMPDGGSEQKTLLLDIDYGEIPCYEKVIPILDKWLLLVQPTAESLSEAYRMIKGTRVLNQRIEYFLVFEGQSSDGLGETIFENMSRLLSERLKINLVWLGYLHPPRCSGHFSADLRLEYLFYRPLLPVDSPEKYALANLAAPRDSPGVDRLCDERLLRF